MANISNSIDGLNISTIGLFDLRSRLAIIPQDPALFEGSVRDNLDPRHAHDDTELWSVLGSFDFRIYAVLEKVFTDWLASRNSEHARLKEHVASMDGQLDATIAEGGT